MRFSRHVQQQETILPMAICLDVSAFAATLHKNIYIKERKNNTHARRRNERIQNALFFSFFLRCLYTCTSLKTDRLISIFHGEKQQ